MTNLAAVIMRSGAPEVIALRELPLPQPAPGQVRLAVRTIGVAFADIYARRGIYPGAPAPPLVPGFDVVGVVDALGADVQGLALGARVAAIIERGGSASTFALQPAAWCLFPRP